MTALYDRDSNMYICSNCGEELDEDLVLIFDRCPNCHEKITDISDNPNDF